MKLIIKILLMMSMFICLDVSAAEYVDSFDEHGMWIANEFINKTKNGSTKYQQMTLIVRKSDGRYVYCIEPGMSINENNSIKGYNYNHAFFADITQAQWERINLLSYYGYGYGNHTDIKWYVITQYMIWQTNNLGYDIYFTDKLNGNRITKYTEEIQELENLVNSYTIIPNFDNVKMLYGDTIKVTDKNNVLNNYVITHTDDLNVCNTNNELTITANNYGSNHIIFTKHNKRFGNDSIVYIADGYQNLLLPGNLSTIYHRREVEVVYGSVSLNKLDFDTNSNASFGSGSLDNAKYGLYDESNNLLETNITKNARINFNTKLKKGRYYIKELEPSVGYLLDEEKHYFDITSNIYNVELTVHEKIITETVEILKLLDNHKDGIMYYEKNAEFTVYKDNKIYKKYVTDEFGKVKFELPYGEYTIKQTGTTSGYNKISEFKIIVKENGKNNEYIFKNELLKYRLKVLTKEKNTLKSISNIKFNLYDNNKKLICYDDNICDFKTNEFGEFLIPIDLNFGTYYIKSDLDNKYEDIEEYVLIINDKTYYQEMKDYRLIEVEFLLETKDKEEMPSEEIEPEPVFDEEPKMPEELKTIEVDDSNQIEEYIEKQGLLIDTPNTLKNDYYLIAILGTFILLKFKQKK